MRPVAPSNPPAARGAGEPFRRGWERNRRPPQLQSHRRWAPHPTTSAAYPRREIWGIQEGAAHPWCMSSCDNPLSRPMHACTQQRSRLGHGDSCGCGGCSHRLRSLHSLGRGPEGAHAARPTSPTYLMAPGASPTSFAHTRAHTHIHSLSHTFTHSLQHSNSLPTPRNLSSMAPSGAAASWPPSRSSLSARSATRPSSSRRCWP
jgi:hypothetical protein